MSWAGRGRCRPRDSWTRWSRGWTGSLTVSRRRAPLRMAKGRVCGTSAQRRRMSSSRPSVGRWGVSRSPTMTMTTTSPSPPTQRPQPSSSRPPPSTSSTDRRPATPSTLPRRSRLRTKRACATIRPSQVLPLGSMLRAQPVQEEVTRQMGRASESIRRLRQARRADCMLHNRQRQRARVRQSICMLDKVRVDVVLRTRHYAILSIVRTIYIVGVITSGSNGPPTLPSVFLRVIYSLSLLNYFRICSCICTVHSMKYWALRAQHILFPRTFRRTSWAVPSACLFVLSRDNQ